MVSSDSEKENQKVTLQAYLSSKHPVSLFYSFLHPGKHFLIRNKGMGEVYLAFLRRLVLLAMASVRSC